jgi:hypothetical protein
MWRLTVTPGSASNASSCRSVWRDRNVGGVAQERIHGEGLLFVAEFCPEDSSIQHHHTSVRGDDRPVGGKEPVGEPEHARRDQEQKRPNREVLGLFGSPGAEHLRDKRKNGKRTGEVANVRSELLHSDSN